MVCYVVGHLTDLSSDSESEEVNAIVSEAIDHATMGISEDESNDEQETSEKSKPKTNKSQRKQNSKPDKQKQKGDEKCAIQ